ncbi:MAG: DUF6029 family protein [Ignavibacteriaceae bacterium]|nr:DUF6029 family protein [Ignavibacteriaceae bacterium]
MKSFYSVSVAVLHLLVIISIPIYSQDSTDSKFDHQYSLPSGVTLLNQLKYSNDTQRNLEIFEDWFNLDYRYDIFSTGIRLVSFEPKDPTVAGLNRKYTDIDFKYLKVDLGDADEGLEVTAGNFYAMFGRGLVLKSYEDRNIRIDNNLLGVLVNGRYMGFTLSALSGMPENLNAERVDVLHAFDLEYDGFNPIKAGFTFASNQPADDAAAQTRVVSFRILPKIWNFEFYGEYAIKQNKDQQQQYFNNSRSIIGKAYYGSMNFYYDKFSLFCEYKYYDNFLFGTADNSVNYNTPPSARKDYSFILLNRHPSPLNQNDEQGYQIEANYTVNDGIFLSAVYGLTKTLPTSSFYQIINNSNLPEMTQLKESLLQSDITWSSSLSTIAAIAYNEELATNTVNITPILENRFYFSDINTINFIIEHQQTRNRTTLEHYYEDVFTLEYLRSPKFSVSLVSEIDTHEPDPGRIVRTLWNFIQFGYNIFGQTDINLLIGSRQAGAICIGGVCRYEPEFHGVEFKMVTRL